MEVASFMVELDESSKDEVCAVFERLSNLEWFGKKMVVQRVVLGTSSLLNVAFRTCN